MSLNEWVETFIDSVRWIHVLILLLALVTIAAEQVGLLSSSIAASISFVLLILLVYFGTRGNDSES